MRLTILKVVKPALKILVSVGLIGWLLHKSNLRLIGHAFATADLRWLAAALGFGFLATFVQTTQWRALLRSFGMPRRWLECLRLVYVGNTFNTLLPSSIGGDVVRAAMVADEPASRVSAAASVVLQRLCNFPGMVVLMAVGLLATLGDAQAGRIRPIAALGVAGAVVGLSICMTPMLGWLSATPLFKRLKLAKLFALLHEFRGKRRELLFASGRGTTFWTLSVLNQWSFMHAVGVPISLSYAALVVTTINALTMLPISINGYGIREGGFVSFLTFNSLATKETALAASFCLVAQSLLWALIGVVCWLTAPQRRRQAVTDSSVSVLEVAA